MPRVPITVMGCRCERCCHEWIPRDAKQQPAVCPKCKSAYWDRPRRKAPASVPSYEDFRNKIRKTLKQAGPLTWTEIRTFAKLPEKFPDHKWVQRLENDIRLRRKKDAHGIFKWKLE